MAQSNNWLIEGNSTFGTVFREIPPGAGTVAARPFPLFRAQRRPECPMPTPIVVSVVWTRQRAADGTFPAMSTDGMKLHVTWGNGNARFGPVLVDFMARTTIIPISACDTVQVDFVNGTNVAEGGKVPSPQTAFNITVSLAEMRSASLTPGSNTVPATPTFSQRFQVAAVTTQQLDVPQYAAAVRVDSASLAHAGVIDQAFQNGAGDFLLAWRDAASTTGAPKSFQMVPAGAERFRFANADAAARDFVVCWKLQL